MQIEVGGRLYDARSDGQVIYGRPDLNGHPDFGITEAKNFPPYVFSVGQNAALMHKIARVELRWWMHDQRGGHTMLRLNKPRMIAKTICGQIRFLTAKRVRTCRVPEPESWLCGRCHGELATFGKGGKATKEGVTRAQAHVKLGCVVTGYSGRSEASLAEDAVDPHVADTGKLSTREANEAIR